MRQEDACGAFGNTDGNARGGHTDDGPGGNADAGGDGRAGHSGGDAFGAAYHRIAQCICRRKCYGVNLDDGDERHRDGDQKQSVPLRAAGGWRADLY